MRIYHDWEFLETHNSVYPISVGMVREDGKELYYEFANMPWGKIVGHSWLMENVIPALRGGNTAFITGTTNDIVKSRLTIANKVADFFEDAVIIGNEQVELWGWYSSYDHVCLCQLFGSMVNLPSYIPMWTNDIKQEAYRLGDVRIPDLRKSQEIVHNALDDAKAEMRMHKWLMEYEDRNYSRVDLR
jgi:hypothetical protein